MFNMAKGIKRKDIEFEYPISYHLSTVICSLRHPMGLNPLELRDIYVIFKKCYP